MMRVLVEWLHSLMHKSGGIFAMVSAITQSEENGARDHAKKSNKDFWATRSKRFLQAELKRRGITYAGLAERMTEMGIPETEGSITVKINRGGFPTWFFLAALNAIGCTLVRLEDV
jgi:hypothetical protein